MENIISGITESGELSVSEEMSGFDETSGNSEMNSCGELDRCGEASGSGKKKAVVLFSGGLDSTVLLFSAKEEFGAENVTALSIYYGQKHDKEVAAAKKIAALLDVRQEIIDLSAAFCFGGSTLLKGGGEIEGGSYASQKSDATQKSGGVIATYVPYRNGLMISAAAAVALSLGSSTLFYGAHTDDAAAAYPDCSAEFFAAIERAVFLGSGGLVTLKAPFIDKKKQDIVAIGLGLKVPFELTWSCYRGGEKPCGECATCRDRQLAFERCGATDPLLRLTDLR